MQRSDARILLADDDAHVLKLFARLLREAGYDVVPVSSGLDAVDILEKDRIDLLVLDLNMPPPDGFELLKIMRAKRPGLRILVISGYLQGALLEASQMLGATASLSKTQASDLLVKTVDGLLL